MESEVIFWFLGHFKKNDVCICQSPYLAQERSYETIEWKSRKYRWVYNIYDKPKGPSPGRASKSGKDPLVLNAIQNNSPPPVGLERGLLKHNIIWTYLKAFQAFCSIWKFQIMCALSRDRHCHSMQKWSPEETHNCFNVPRQKYCDKILPRISPRTFFKFDDINILRNRP